MLTAKHRLERNLFKLLFKNGKKIIFSNFNLIYAKNKSSKIGFVVSSALSKKTVFRNRLKRRARAIISRRLKDFTGPFTMAFIFKKQCLNLSFKELEKEMILSLKKIGIIK